MANILDGKKCAEAWIDSLKDPVQTLTQKRGRPPCLATVLVGDDPASHVYVSHKIKTCQRLGIRSDAHKLSASVSQHELETLIHALNTNSEVDGILVQMPLPAHLNARSLINHLDPQKDVDGFHPHNMGALLCDQPGMIACTPLGVMEMLRFYNIPIEGRHAVVIGRSLTVGRPLALLLSRANATVTLCHARTVEPWKLANQADIVVAAAGKANLVDAQWIQQGAVVVDVGIHRLEQGGLCGDVKADEVSQLASWLSPVPGGVGPLTIAALMANTVSAAGGLGRMPE